MSIRTHMTEEYLLYYEEGQDPYSEFIAQYHFATRKLSNFWNTVELTMSPNCTRMMEVVVQLKAFEESIAGELA